MSKRGRYERKVAAAPRKGVKAMLITVCVLAVLVLGVGTAAGLYVNSLLGGIVKNIRPVLAQCPDRPAHGGQRRADHGGAVFGVGVDVGDFKIFAKHDDHRKKRDVAKILQKGF